MPQTADFDLSSVFDGEVRLERRTLASLLSQGRRPSGRRASYPLFLVVLVHGAGPSRTGEGRPDPRPHAHSIVCEWARISWIAWVRRTPKHPVAVTWPAHLPDRFADQREDDRSREVAARGRKETPRRSRGWLPRPVTARSPARIHGRGTRVVGHSVWSRASRRRPLGTQGVALW